STIVVIPNYRLRGIIMTPGSILRGTAILLALQWVSVLFLQALHIAFPPALLGMILLAVLLLTGVIREQSVEDACTILIEKMGMLFLPAGISMLLYLDIIKAESAAIFVTIIVSSLIILVTTTAFVELLSRSRKGGKN
ncbi:CidA/LrgA family protein, partial [Phascolarctobacterium sp.]